MEQKIEIHANSECSNVRAQKLIIIRRIFLVYTNVAIYVLRINYYKRFHYTQNLISDLSIFHQLPLFHGFRFQLFSEINVLKSFSKIIFATDSQWKVFEELGRQWKTTETNYYILNLFPHTLFSWEFNWKCFTKTEKGCKMSDYWRFFVQNWKSDRLAENLFFVVLRK